ncbi:MAG: PEGA domain-containing protein [Sandaracinaceae bacterium]|nr:PEGA domain-containing protein [Sandaracinaceae bacterium]
MRAWVPIALGLALWASAPSAGRAQVVVVDADGASEAAARRWRERVVAAQGADAVELEAWAGAEEPVATVPPDRLLVLAQIERRLMLARHARSRFRERDALDALTQAEELAERHLDVPGMAAWYAEVQLAIAITAAQLGQAGVSEAALRRAASVDASRSVQAAEAHPDVVARARAIARAAATGPRGRFEVRSDAAGAVAYLDDGLVGPLPATVEAPVGPHVLRVDAPAHRGWASVVTVFEGDRPAIEVTLAPTAQLTQARAAARAATVGDLDALVGALSALEEAPVVHRVRLGAGPLDRALLTTCDASGCRGPMQLEGAPGPSLTGPIASVAESERWLLERPAIHIDEPEWWERWYVWAAVAAVVAIGVGVGIGLAVAQDQGAPPPLVLVVDPSRLPVAGVD